MSQPSITTDDVLYAAALSKIAITPEEAQVFTKELDAILGYVRQLDAIDTTGLQPTYQVTGLKNVMRPDVIEDYHVTPGQLLQNAPRQLGGALQVPKVL